MKKILFLFLSFFLISISYGQRIQIIDTHKNEVSFRGLSVLDEYTFWLSGSQGTIGISVNGGKSFIWKNPKGYENRDFRAIHAFNHKMIIAIAVGSPAVILKSFDSGNSWAEVYRDEHPDAFLDAVSFYYANPNIGFAIGDPVDGQPYVLKTTDAGTNWAKLDETDLPKLNSGEAFFAASNSNLVILEEDLFLSASGGSVSNLILNSLPATKVNLPKSEVNTAGANGLDYHPLEQYGLVVGGDFNRADDSTHNLFIFKLDNQKKPKIELPITAPTGYKSGVAILNNGKAISCGLKGVDYSSDGGKNWKLISENPFHSCKKANISNQVYLVGPNGKVGILKP